MLRHGLLAALVLVFSVSPACRSSSSTPETECIPTGAPVRTINFGGLWQVVPTVPANGRDPQPEMSSLYLSISEVPVDTNESTPENCGGAGTKLKVTYVSGDERFKNAVLSAVFKPSAQGGGGTLTLELGNLSITADILADGTVDRTSALWREDGGTRSAQVTLLHSRV